MRFYVCLPVSINVCRTSKASTTRALYIDTCVPVCIYMYILIGQVKVLDRN